MSKVILELKLMNPTVLVGASIPVKVLVKNQGESTVSLHDKEFSDPFRYVLRRTSDSEAAYILSAKAARLARSIDPIPPMPEPMKELAPGAQDVFSADLAIYTPVPLPAEEYLLSAVYSIGEQELVSAEIPLNISIPRVKALSAVLGVSEPRLSLLFAHAFEDGSLGVYQMESAHESYADGIAYKHALIAAPDNANHSPFVATALDLYPNQGVRWLIWLSGSVLGAGVAQFHHLFLSKPPMDIPLEAAELYELAFQLANDSVVVPILGQNAEKQPILAIVRIKANGPSELQLFPLSLSRRPSLWKAQARRTEGGIVLDFVFATHDQGQGALQLQSILLGESRALEPILLQQHGSMPLALSIAPLALESAGIAEVLWAPIVQKDKPPHLGFSRIPLDNPKAAVSIPLPVHAPPETEFPRRYLLPEAPSDFVMLAHEGSLFKLTLGKPGESLAWSVSKTPWKIDTPIRFTRAENQSTWAVWADPSAGLCIQRIDPG